MLKLYGNYKSGNVYKASLALNLLHKTYQEVQIGLGPNTESESPEFLAINPLGQIPVLATESGEYISQSNAILWYLAQDTDYLPSSALQQAKVMQWMCFEQYELEPNLAWSRWICYLKNQASERADDLKRYHQAGYRAMNIIEAQLAVSSFIVGPDITIADIALFAYIHNCDQGGLSLTNYPLIRNWIDRIKAREGFVPMSEQFSQFDY